MDRQLAYYRRRDQLRQRINGQRRRIDRRVALVWGPLRQWPRLSRAMQGRPAWLYVAAALLGYGVARATARRTNEPEAASDASAAGATTAGDWWQWTVEMIRGLMTLRREAPANDE